MKTHAASWLMAALISTSLMTPLAGLAKPVQLKGAVYSPQAGVICDKKAGFCADREGVAVALTQLYLGDKAEKKLMDMIRQPPGGQEFDTSIFVLSNKVACDCKARTCKISKYEDQIDAAHTNALFGN